MNTDPKHDADSGNDSTNEMLAHEKLIDPGNEHRHEINEDDKMPEEEHRKKNDADAGGDATGTAGPQPSKADS